MIDAPMKKLGDICDIASGGTPKRSERSYWDGGSIPWVKISDITEKYVRSTEEFITDEGLAHSSAKLIQPGTVLYSIFASIGATGILTISAATNQAIAAVRPKNENLTTDYLYHWLKAQKSAAKASSRGVAQSNINLSILRAMEIPVPSSDMQESIVSNFDGILSKRDDYEKQLEKLDELVKSRFVEMFGDPESNPMEYEVANLGDVLSVQPSNGMYKPQKDYVADGSGVPIVRIDSFRPEGPDYPRLKRLTCDDKEIRRYGLHEHDIVINRVNSVGCMGKTMLVANLPEPVVFESNMMRLHADEGRLHPEFLCVQMTSDYSKAYFEGNAKRAIGQASINQTDVKSLLVMVPPMQNQNSYLAFVQQVDKLKFETQQAIDKLQMLYDSLAQEYFAIQ